GVVGHAGFSTRFSGSRRLPETRIAARPGRCLRIVRFPTLPDSRRIGLTLLPGTLRHRFPSRASNGPVGVQAESSQLLRFSDLALLRHQLDGETVIVAGVGAGAQLV